MTNPEKSEIQRRAPNRFRWTPELLALLGRISDERLAEIAGISRRAVRDERGRRGIEPSHPRRPRIEWTEEMISLLGTDSDARVADQLDIDHSSVSLKRRAVGIPPCYPPPHDQPMGHVWTDSEIALLGTLVDREVAEILGLSPHVVAYRRSMLQIPPCCPPAPTIKWTDEMWAQLGSAPDSEVAARFGISAGSVVAERRRRGVGPFLENGAIVRNDELIDLLHRPTVEIRRETTFKHETIRHLRGELGIPTPPPSTLWTPEALSRLGREPDRAIARDLGLSTSRVAVKRRELGLPSPERRWRRWTPQETDLLGKRPDREIAEALGRSLGAVKERRRLLGIPAPPGSSEWRPEEIALLGEIHDAEVAERLGRSLTTVRKKRRQLGRKAAGRHYPRWRPEEIALLGTELDREVAEALGRSPGSVTAKRRKLGIPGASPNDRWRPEEMALLGTAPDDVIAEKLGRSPSAVRTQRCRRGIPLSGNRPEIGPSAQGHAGQCDPTS